MARENGFKQSEKEKGQTNSMKVQKTGKQQTNQKSSKKITASTVMFIPNTRNSIAENDD